MLRVLCYFRLRLSCHEFKFLVGSRVHRPALNVGGTLVWGCVLDRADPEVTIPGEAFFSDVIARHMHRHLTVPMGVCGEDTGDPQATS